jgi:hypothetical protein
MLFKLIIYFPHKVNRQPKLFLKTTQPRQLKKQLLNYLGIHSLKNYPIML